MNLSNFFNLKKLSFSPIKGEATIVGQGTSKKADGTDGQKFYSLVINETFDTVGIPDAGMVIGKTVFDRQHPAAYQALETLEDNGLDKIPIEGVVLYVPTRRYFKSVRRNRTTGALELNTNADGTPRKASSMRIFLFKREKDTYEQELERRVNQLTSSKYWLEEVPSDVADEGIDI